MPVADLYILKSGNSDWAVVISTRKILSFKEKPLKSGLSVPMWRKQSLPGYLALVFSLCPSLYLSKPVAEQFVLYVYYIIGNGTDEILHLKLLPTLVLTCTQFKLMGFKMESLSISTFPKSFGHHEDILEPFSVCTIRQWGQDVPEVLDIIVVSFYLQSDHQICLMVKKVHFSNRISHFVLLLSDFVFPGGSMGEERKDAPGVFEARLAETQGKLQNNPIYILCNLLPRDS